MMAQVATAGLNNVMCMLPARDLEEFKLFPAEDVAFIQAWLNFTDRQLVALRNTVPLPGMDVVTLGGVDGTAAFEQPLSCTNDSRGAGDNATGGRIGGNAAFERVLGVNAHPSGFIFLFNPGYKPASAAVILDDSLSPQSLCTATATATTPTPTLHGGGTSRSGESFVVSEIYPEQKNVGTYKYGDTVRVVMDGSSAKSFSVTAASRITLPYVMGAAVTSIEVNGSVATLIGVQAEAGTVLNNLTLTIPTKTTTATTTTNNKNSKNDNDAAVIAGTPSFSAITSVVINGRAGAVSAAAPPPSSLGSSGEFLVYALPPLKFGKQESEQPFPHAKEVSLHKSSSANGNTTFTGTVMVPSTIFAQLSARAQAYPIPWTKQDNDVRTKLLLRSTVHNRAHRRTTCRLLCCYRISDVTRLLLPRFCDRHEHADMQATLLMLPYICRHHGCFLHAFFSTSS